MKSQQLTKTGSVKSLQAAPQVKSKNDDKKSKNDDKKAVTEVRYSELFSCFS